MKLLEEMKKSGVKANGQTYICLLNAFASTGHIDRVYAFKLPYFVQTMVLSFDIFSQNICFNFENNIGMQLSVT